MTNQFKILDTFQDFSGYWMDASAKSVDEQIRLWQTCYMNNYPELLDKQIQCYQTENINWLDIAKRVFPTFPERLQLMHTARKYILAYCEAVYAQASDRLGIDFEILIVIYVGIGCGAGWATRYSEKPAILLGLKNIAEENWHTKTKIRGLVSHELGHLTHMEWRDEWETFGEKERDPLFRLYSDGFAQRCEQLITGRETWHMAENRMWSNWCKRNKGWLAREFLNRIRTNKSVNEFFGSLFNIQGKKQTGYLLGHAFISELGKIYSLREIAMLKVDDVKTLALQYLNTTIEMN